MSELPPPDHLLNLSAEDRSKTSHLVSTLTTTLLSTLEPIPALSLLPPQAIADLSDCVWSDSHWYYAKAIVYIPPPFLPNFYLNVMTPKVSQAKIHVRTVLSSTSFIIDWSSLITDDALHSLVDTGFMVLDTLFEDDDLLALQLESGFVDYRDALLTDGLRRPDIRGDRIRWINADFLAGTGYLHCIDDLGQFFNRTLYTGIRRSEAHYACYPTGFGYQWHYDNPAGRDDRVISAVFYLNDDWTAQDGGALALIDKRGETHQLLPKANRLVLFDSNLYHQVEIAYRQRYSIATWLRRDDLATVVGLVR